MSEQATATTPSPQDDEKTDSKNCYFGQLIYFDRIMAASDCRPVMARIALNIAGHGLDYPVLLTEVLSGLGWENYMATLNFMTLAANVQIRWSPMKLAYLKQWAREVTTVPAPNEDPP